MSTTKFILQGLDENNDHFAAVDQLLGLPDIERCLICVAFMNAAGAGMVADKLSAISHKLQLFVGIRNGVTSKQGIEVLKSKNIFPVCVDTATQAFIFHPKVYLAQSQTSATLITGSANFTSGGLIKNIEASLIVNLDLSIQADLELVEKVINDFASMQREHPENVFQLDDTADLDAMVQQGLLEDETVQLQRANAKAQNTQSRTEQRPRMKTHVRKLPSVRRTKVQPDADVVVPHSAVAFKAVTNNQLLWKSKPLKRRDLNIPDSTGTNPTGSMYLKVGDPSQNIDQRHYFREVVFCNAAWQHDANPRYNYYERCFVKFRIIIKGVDYGVHELKLSHDTRTNTPTYLQKNSVTQIHWGSAVKPMIAHEDLLDGVVCIYAPEEAADTYTLTFDME